MRDENRTLIGRYCGSDLPTVFSSPNNNLHLRFVSNAQDAATGFELQYHSVSQGMRSFF